MNNTNEHVKNEMIAYIEHLLKSGIYCFGNNLHMLAIHLVSSGCRINVGPRRKKYLERSLNE